MAFRYRGGRPLPDLHGGTALVVDDGVVTGTSARAACTLARERGARRVLFASPVATPDAIAGLFAVADEVVRVAAPLEVRDLARWYTSFPPVRDQDLVDLLRHGSKRSRSA
jgi:putative phosphoribosyl transferase